MTEPLLRVANLAASRGGRRALEGVSFELAAGECLGVAGPNGAGKSTLLEAVAGLLPAASGVVEVRGVQRRPGRIAAEIGYAPQQPVFYPRLTGRENLLLFGELYEMPAQRLERRLTELADELQLWEWLDRPAETYSGGIAQRLHLALAMVHRPSLLLLDEPTAGLDPASRQAVLHAVAARIEHGGSVIVTSQILNDLELIAGRVMLLAGGRVAALEETAAVLRRLGGDVIQIECLRQPGASPDLQGLAGVRGWEVSDALLRVRVSDPAEVLPALLERLRKQGIQPARIEILPPTLTHWPAELAKAAP